MTKNKVETSIEGNRVIYKRYYDVPIHLAFEAWSSPEHLEKWWGPDGFTITTKSMNFSKGGIWDFIMHSPDGRDYKNTIQFTEIVEPTSIHYKHFGHGEGIPDVLFESIIIFEKAGDGTNLTMVQIFPSKEELERLAKHFGAIEGGKQHLGNLGKYLENEDFCLNTLEK